LPAYPAAPHIPAWLLSETAIAFKLGAVVIFLLGFDHRFQILVNTAVGKFALREVKPAPVAASSAALVEPAAEFPEELLPTLDTALRLLRDGDNLDALDSLNKMLVSHPKIPSFNTPPPSPRSRPAIQGGGTGRADASIKSGFRISDSWALKAAIAATLSKGATPEREPWLKKASRPTR